MRRSRGSRRVALTALLALAAGGGSAQTPPPSLSPGPALERAFAADESQVFTADLAAGRVYLVAVEQRGIHLAVDVRGPDGESLASVDSRRCCLAAHTRMGLNPSRSALIRWSPRRGRSRRCRFR